MRTPALFNGKDLTDDLTVIFDDEKCVNSQGFYLGYVDRTITQAWIEGDNKIHFIFAQDNRKCLNTDEIADLLERIKNTFLEVYDGSDLEIDVDEEEVSLSFYFSDSQWEKLVNEMSDEAFNRLSRIVLKRAMSL